MGKDNALTLQFKDTPVDKETAAGLQTIFMPFFEQAEEWKKKAEKINITSIDQVEDMKDAREARLALKNIRVGVEHTRKTEKEQSLRKGKAIDGMANVIKYLIVPIEEHLQKQEDFVKEQEAKQKVELQDKRQKELEKYVEDTSFYSLGEMPEETYLELLSNSKSAHDNRIALERKAEEERIEAEKTARLNTERKEQLLPYWQFINEPDNLGKMSKEDFDVLLKKATEDKEAHEAEQERVRKENERLEKEAKEKEQALQKEREEAEAKRLAAEEKYRKQREAAAQKASKEQEKQQETLRKEREAKEKVEAELKAKEEEEKRLETERKEQEKDARLAPDKDKLEALVTTIQAIGMPVVKSEEAKLVIKDAQTLLDKTCTHITDKTKSM